ncbi:MAG: sporulation protein YunB [Traorella sp.]
MRIKKRFVGLFVISSLLVVFLYLYQLLFPIFRVKAEAYFHEIVISEIILASESIKIMDDFVIQDDHQMKIHTVMLNKWISQVSQLLHQKIENHYTEKIPLGYFTGNMYLLNKGPKLSYDFLIDDRIQCRYDIKSTALGINNVLIELILHVQCQGYLFIGFEKSECLIVYDIPLVLQYIQGEVPQIFPY